MPTQLRDEFMLDPDVVFLNHGSFGACPRPVFDTYQFWQREMERQPVEFYQRRYDDVLDHARGYLGDYVGTSADNLIFLPNATVAINMVARSIRLEAGDEVLTTDHEYGAMDKTWEFVCGKTGAKLIHHPIPLPVPTAHEIVEGFWSKVTPRTKVIFISHYTSPTALIMPIEPIIQRARAAGIITVIDGAHIPGQIDLNLDDLGADYYTGNLHKWLCAPKVAGFLYARPELHPVTDPLIISWGYVRETTFTGHNRWQGTTDVSPYLAVPAAIDFQRDHAWDTVRVDCHGLASETRGRVAELFDLPPIQPDSTEWFRQMVAMPLPECDAVAIKARLVEEYNVEVPLTTWNDCNFLRVSYQGYNSVSDMEALLAALQGIFRE
jgi:isopenicillin-N epimerase